MIESLTKEPGMQRESRISPAANGSGPIFELRRNLGLTQHALAQEIGFSLRGVAQLEKQGRVPLNTEVRTQLIELARHISSDQPRNEILEALQSRARRKLTPNSL